MVRLKGTTDSLADLTGHLSAGFGAASLSRLHQTLVDAAPAEKRDATQTVLSAFYDAATSLRKRESEFNNRARPAAGKPDLSKNLRSADHFAAIRQFNELKQQVQEIDPAVGATLVRTVERAVTPRAPAPKR